MRDHPFALPALLLCAASAPRAQEPALEPASRFETAAAALQDDLQESLALLEAERARITEEKLPLSRRLAALEEELIRTRAEYNQAARRVDRTSLAVSNLTADIKKREAETDYLANLLGEYVRELEASLHIAELQRYAAVLEEAELAAENTALSQREVFGAQVALVTASLDRLEDALGGTRFEGTAVGPDGTVEEGTFVLVGPASVFRAKGSAVAGTAEQRLGSLEPTEVRFHRPEDVAAALELVDRGTGFVPVDVTLGNAHKIAATEETFLEHVRKGGAVMVPIFVLAGLALLVALYKWVSLSLVRNPSRKQLNALLDAVGDQDEERARNLVRGIPGPAGRMLAAGVEHMGEPRELIEEVMYERLLTTRLKLQSLLPFIAICAASAPLLGLLGTVTGIISTFKMITVFGSGDVKSLSGGISEALITTKFGLIVAIPSLLLHAFLSRKAKGVVDRMERTAIALVNRVRSAPEPARVVYPASASAGEAPDPELVRAQVNAILKDLLNPLVAENDLGPPPRTRPAPAR